MRRLCPLLIALLAATSALGQRPQGVRTAVVGGGGNPPPVLIGLQSKAVDPVVGLHYKPSISDQEGFSTVSVEVQNKPASATVTYSWHGTGISFDSPSEASTIARVHSTGSFVATCDVSVSGSTMSTYTGTVDAKFWCIGGPLQMGVRNGISSTPKKDGAATTPFYLQYFGYDPRTTQDQYTQPTQQGTCVIAMSQPEGVTWSWQLTGPAVITFPTSNSDTAQSISVGANGPSGGGGDIQVKCVFKMTFGTSSYTVFDDTEESPIEGVIEPQQSRFTAHYPKSTASRTPKPFDHMGENPCSDYWYFLLTDQLGSKMPRVWINEYFPSGVPTTLANGAVSNINVNSDGSGWTTDNSGIFGPDWMTLGADGVTYNYPSTGPPLLVMTHTFMAGTTHAHGHGVACSSWKMSYWSDMTLQELQP